MSLQLIIPTRGRTNNQLTALYLPKELRAVTTIVCPKREVFALEGVFKDIAIEAQPDPAFTISEKRAWIMEEWARRGHDKIIMLDDDLRFATRISDTDWHLRECEPPELNAVFRMLEDKLGEDYPHVGLGPRQGNQTIKEPGWRVPGKMTYVLGYYLPVVLRECVLRRINLREDMELTLQLLLKGYPNAIWNETVVDQREFGNVGGASYERTIEKSNEEAHRLAALFPGYVTVVSKKYKASTPREEVICQWLKALQDGQMKRNQLPLF